MMYSFVGSGHPSLNTAIKKTEKITKNNRKTINEMIKLLKETPDAAAIAANQLGITDLRVFVCKNGENGVLVIINPKIIWSSTSNPLEIIQNNQGEVLPKSVPMWESCLSFPGKSYLVNRDYAIKVEYMNEKDVFKKVTLVDQWARLFAHEIDHLNGICIKDRATEVMDIEELI